MIRDSTIYIDMDKIIDTDENKEDNIIEEENNDNSEESEKITKNKNSFVYLRCVHSDCNLFIKNISTHFKKEEICTHGYDNIFNETEKVYMLSNGFLNYEPKYIIHLRNIMKYSPKYLTLICDPLQRILRHFFHSNSLRTIYTFDEYYHYYGDKDNVGWTGKNKITNNFFAKYLGFSKEEDITKENITKRFSLVMVSELHDESWSKLDKLLGVQVERCEFINNKYNVTLSTKEKFKENNQLDYKLYEVCCNLLNTIT